MFFQQLAWTTQVNNKRIFQWLTRMFLRVLRVPVVASTPSVNGTASLAPASEKKAPKPREAPMIGVSLTGAEYAEVKAALTKTLGGLEMNVPLGRFSRLAR